ncbi:MAG: 1,4-dihydroxy-2-naphthoate polyprenyltransferase [Candidatus Hydrogenedentes bacterium]|nr:1,4-dihydroxy-2-naphthoate polyprenyltransferase [Candidatus Hydrogenedentota bacterium]
MTDAAPSKLRIWLMAARPKTLGAAVAPVIIGTAIAYADMLDIHWPSLVSALLGAMLIQIGTNFANDYFDFVKGTDTKERIGPTRATQAGLVSPKTMRLAFVATFAAALIPGAYIIYRGGWPFVLIGLVSIVCGILYTGGPFPLGYLGLGDVFVLIFFGPVAVCGTYYLHGLELTPAVAMPGVFDLLLAGIAPGLISVALLTVNNLRDVEQDKISGKKTLAVRFGRGFARLEFQACILLACLVLPLHFYWVTGNMLMWVVPAVTLPLASRTLRTVYRSTDGAALNRALGETGRLLIVFSIVFSAGWAL